MIIGVDGGCFSISDKRLKVGVYQYSKELLRQLGKLDKKNKYHLYSFLPVEKKILSLFGSNTENIIINPSLGWFKIWLPKYLKNNPPDVFLGLSQSLPRLPSQTKSIVFVYDLTFEKKPQWFRNSYSKMSENTKQGVDKANKIITLSQSTKKDLIEIYKVESQKIEVIPAGVDTRLNKYKDKKFPQELKIKTPFFLFVGTFKQSKNIPNIIKAFYKFRNKYPQYSLVFVGSNYWMDEEIPKVLHKLNLGGSVRILGFVDDKILSFLYSNATAFVSPSFNEGFGLTHVEAASFKLPIISSTLGASKEMLGDGSLYVEPTKIDSITDAMELLVINKKLRNKLIKSALLNISQLSWEKSAKEILSIINSYEK